MSDVQWGRRKVDGVYGGRKVQRGMAVSAHTTEIKFFIPNEHFKLVWDALKKWQHHSVSKSGTYSHRVVSIFNRAIEFGTKIEGPDKLEDLVDIWYKDTSIHRQREQAAFLQKIAKYVKAGSYINWEGGEPWHFWQWYFNGDCMIEKTGVVVYR